MTAVLDRRAAGEVGRRARLELVFAERGGRTVVAHCYAEPPFRSVRGFADGGGLHVILTSAAPGIFGGDRLDQSIVVQEGARVTLTSQSAPQLHASAGGDAAVVRSEYHVADGAALSCHWDPLIPFAAARLDQRIEVQLAGRARLYWSDALMTGREARGERWSFSSIAHELRICRGKTLAYLERFRIAPLERGLSHPWVAEDAAFLGTTIVSGVGGSTPDDAERMHLMLEQIAGVNGSADVLGESLLVVRLMAAHGVPFHEARQRLRSELSSR
jgi:urease accessory protein